MKLTDVSSPRLDDGMTRVALQRQLNRLQSIRTVRGWWMAAAERQLSESEPQTVWEVQRELESRGPELSDFVGIVLGDLEDRGLIRVSKDGKFEQPTSDAVLA